MSDTLRSKLYDYIVTIIEADLIDGRSDNGLKPFTTEEVAQFIFENSGNIQDTIDAMIKDYTEDEQLEDLENPFMDWIREYLYEYVRTDIDGGDDEDAADADEDEQEG